MEATWKIIKQNNEYVTTVTNTREMDKLIEKIQQLLPEYTKEEIFQHLVYYGAICDHNLTSEQIRSIDEEHDCNHFEEADNFGNKLNKALRENPNNTITQIIFNKR